MVLMEYHNGGYSKSWSDVPPGSDEYAWETWERVTRRGLAPEGTGTSPVSWSVTVRTRGGPPNSRQVVRQWQGRILCQEPTHPGIQELDEPAVDPSWLPRVL